MSLRIRAGGQRLRFGRHTKSEQELFHKSIRRRFGEVEFGWHYAVENKVAVAFEGVQVRFQGSVHFSACLVDALAIVRVRKFPTNFLYNAVEAFSRGSMTGAGIRQFIAEDPVYSAQLRTVHDIRVTWYPENEEDRSSLRRHFTPWPLDLQVSCYHGPSSYSQ